MIFLTTFVIVTYQTWLVVGKTHARYETEYVQKYSDFPELKALAGI